MTFPRSNSDTTRLVYTSTEEGEPSKSGEQRSNTSNNYKLTCHNCRKIGHIIFFCRSNNVNQNSKKKFIGNYHKCNNQGHRAHKWKAKITSTQRFKGYY